MTTNHGLVVTRADRNCTPVAHCTGISTRVPPQTARHTVPQSAPLDVNGPRAEEHFHHGLVCGCEFRKLRPQYTSTGTITPEGMHIVTWDGDRVIDVIDTRKPLSESERAEALLRRGGRTVI